MDRSCKYAFCSKCFYFMWNPVTCQCGRTICIRCTHNSNCSCKSASQLNTANNGPFVINKTIQNITQQYIDIVLTPMMGFKASKPEEKIKLNFEVNQFQQFKRRRERKVISIAIGVYNKKRNTALKPEELPPWLQASDIQCTICMDTFMEPITTPCGHMFCKLCLERFLYYSNSCPLCVARLNHFDASKVNETYYMGSLLRYVNKYKPPRKQEMFVPIISIECCVYPNVPTVLILEDSIFLLNLLASPKKLLGIVTIIDGEEPLDVGTIVEIRDVVLLECGVNLLTVIGTDRFKILNRYKADLEGSSFLLGHIQKFYDTCIPYNSTGSEYDPADVIAMQKYRRVLTMAKMVFIRAKRWYATLDTIMQANICSILDIPNLELFYVKQTLNCVNRSKQQGPDWLWNLITVLPVNDKHKTMLLKSEDIELRLHNIYSTLIYCCNHV